MMNDVSPFDYLKSGEQRDKERDQQMQQLVDCGITYSVDPMLLSMEFRIELDKLLVEFTDTQGQASGVIVNAALFTKIRCFGPDYYDESSLNDIFRKNIFGWLRPSGAVLRVWNLHPDNKVTIY